VIIGIAREVTVEHSDEQFETEQIRDWLELESIVPCQNTNSGFVISVIAFKNESQHMRH
jgi:hypothetical protein